MPKDDIEVGSQLEMDDTADTVITDHHKLDEFNAASSITDELIDLKGGIDHLELTIAEAREALSSGMGDDPDLREQIEETMGNSSFIINKLKDKISLMIDDHLGVGALSDSRREGVTHVNEAAGYQAWGASKRNIGSTPTLPVAEAGMIKELVKVANSLDKKGLVKEADLLDAIIKGIKNVKRIN